MKIKNNNILKKIADEYIILPLDGDNCNLEKVFKINETAVDIYELLKEDLSYDDLINKMLNLYNIEKNILVKDINEFLALLNEKGLLDV